LSNVVELQKPFDHPDDILPVPPGSLDAVIIDMNYHDMVGRGYDRARINAAVFKALKPGGVYGVIDNSAAPGSGARDANTLHRIDEAFEINEIKQAGFKLAAGFGRTPQSQRRSNLVRYETSRPTRPVRAEIHQAAGRQRDRPRTAARVSGQDFSRKTRYMKCEVTL
jgi:hypothetical protein